MKDDEKKEKLTLDDITIMNINSEEDEADDNLYSYDIDSDDELENNNSDSTYDFNYNKDDNIDDYYKKLYNYVNNEYEDNSEKINNQIDSTENLYNSENNNEKDNNETNENDHHLNFKSSNNYNDSIENVDDNKDEENEKNNYSNYYVNLDDSNDNNRNEFDNKDNINNEEIKRIPEDIDKEEENIKFENKKAKEIKLKHRNNNSIIKILMIVFISCLIFLILRLFIFNNKNKMLNEITDIYDDVINILEEIDDEAEILNSDYINIKSNYKVNYEQDESKDYKLEYLEDDKNDITNLKIDEVNGSSLINNKYKNLNIFSDDGVDRIEYITDLMKRTLYKSLDIDKFSRINEKDDYIINLKLSDKDIKRILRRVIQKVKLNKKSVNIISEYTNKDNNYIVDYFDNILKEIDKSKFRYLKLDMYYKRNEAYKCVVKYANYEITYNINNKNLLIKKENNKLLDISFNENGVISSGDSRYILSMDHKDIDDRKAINFVLKDGNGIIATMIYKIKEVDDNKYSGEVNISVDSQIDKIKSFGIEANVEIINDK